MDRRGFLKFSFGTAAMTAFPLPATAGWLSRKQEPETSLYGQLKQFKFMGEDGQPVNIDALKTAIGNKAATLSFGFGACSSICPLINTKLAAIGDIDNDRLVSIAINAWPELEGQDGIRPDFAKSIKNVGAKQKVITLFPTDAKGNLSNEAAAKAQIAFGQFINEKDPNQHSGYILLFDADGRMIAEKSSTKHSDEEFMRDWAPLIASATQKLER